MFESNNHSVRDTMIHLFSWEESGKSQQQSFRVKCKETVFLLPRTRNALQSRQYQSAYQPWSIHFHIIAHLIVYCAPIWYCIKPTLLNHELRAFTWDLQPKSGFEPSQCWMLWINLRMHRSELEFLIFKRSREPTFLFYFCTRILQ